MLAFFWHYSSLTVLAKSSNATFLQASVIKASSQTEVFFFSH